MHVYMFTNCRKGTILHPGIKEQIFVSIFQLVFTFVCCVNVWVQGFFYVCVENPRTTCGCQVLPSIMLVLRIKFQSSDLAENALNLLSWLFLLLPQILISNTNPSKGTHVFSVLLKCHRMEMVGFQGLGRTIKG